MSDLVEDDGFEYSLENLDIYKIAIAISDLSWIVFNELSFELKNSIGNQFLGAADSIGANISEGYGRFHYKESINFNNYARGSAFETMYWLDRLSKRALITKDHFKVLNELLGIIIIKINAYNKYLRTKNKKN